MIVPCSSCNGTGERDGQTCSNCGGTGEIDTEHKLEIQLSQVSDLYSRLQTIEDGLTEAFTNVINRLIYIKGVVDYLKDWVDAQ